jgi:hypothetical protein
MRAGEDISFSCGLRKLIGHRFMKTEALVGAEIE